MNTGSASRHSIGEYSSDREAVTDRSSSPPSPPPTSFKFTSGRGGRTRDSSPEIGNKVKQESEDEGYEGYTYQEYGRISPDTTPSLSKPRTPNRKRRRATVVTPMAKSIAPGKQERKKPTRKITAKKQLPSKIKNEPNEEDDWAEDDRQGESHVRYEPAGWTKEELDLVHELCKKNKTGEEIWSELRNKLGCTKSRGSVSNCRRRVKISQVEWSSEDVCIIYIPTLLIFICRASSRLIIRVLTIRLSISSRQ